MPPVDMNGLRQALAAQMMQRQGQPMAPAMPGAMRAMPGQALRGGMPNTPGMPQPGMPQPAGPAPTGMGGQPGAATPPQQASKVAQQAQSPMMDPETRQKAKELALKLMQQM